MQAFEKNGKHKDARAPAIRPQTPATVAQMRVALDRNGYAKRTLDLLAAPRKLQELRAEDSVLTAVPADALIHLFFLNRPVRVDIAAKALAPSSVQEWDEAGLLRRTGDLVAPLVMLTPYKGLVIASDFDSHTRLGMDAHAVNGLTKSGLWLAGLTVRRYSRLTLDLVTGCGIQSLLAAQHSDHVIAVDTNPRAIEIAQFNAQLNSIANVEYILGDFFEPVAECHFDLIVSNLPCKIGPHDQVRYLDRSVKCDELLQHIVQRVPRHLHRDGFAQIAGDWIEYYAQDWRQRLAGWVRSIPCDTWVMQRQARRPSEYAESCVSPREPPEFEQQYEDRLNYFRQNNIEAVVSGNINLRSSSAKTHWYRVSFGPRRLLPDAGRDVEQVFRLQDYLATLPDNKALLNLRLRVLPMVRIEQQCRAGDGSTVKARLVRTRGIALSIPVSSDIMNIVRRCNGERPLGQLLHDVAVQKDMTFEDASRQMLGRIRELVADGFMVPVGDCDSKFAEENGRSWARLEEDNRQWRDQIGLADTIAPTPNEGDTFSRPSLPKKRL